MTAPLFVLNLCFMKLILTVLLVFFYIITYSQISLTICQKCGYSKVSFSGYKDSVGVKINDSCSVFSFSIEEPEYLSMHTSTDISHEYRFWIDPRYKRKPIILNNCHSSLEILDTLPIEKDDLPCDKVYSDLTSNPEPGKEDSLMKVFTLCEEMYIESHPDSFLALNYLRTVLSKLDIQQAIKYRDLVKKSNSKYPSYTEVENYISNFKYKNIANTGDSFLEFEAQTSGGEKFLSKGINDKVILLYFWYSSCGPCKKVGEPLRAMYEQYKSKQFEIISFSIDDEEEWKKASEKLKYPWINVSDQGGKFGILPNHYGVDRFPFFVVFDVNKKISLITFGEDEVPLIESRVKDLLHIK